jgi:hypothetical protein
MKPILLSLAFLCTVFTPLRGITFTVSNTNNSGVGSLRQAIDDANNTAGADVIVFDGALANQTITVISPFLVITSDVTINGSGAANLTISGNGTDPNPANRSRIFWIQNGTITIQNLTLADGYAKGGDGSGGGMGAGGAIFMHEGRQDPNNNNNLLSGSIDLRLVNVILKNNKAIGGSGGGTFVGGGGLGGSGGGGGGGGGVLGNGDVVGGSVTSASGITPGMNGGIAIFGNGGVYGGGPSGVGADIPGFGGGGGATGDVGGFGSFGGGGAFTPLRSYGYGGFGGGGGGGEGFGGFGGGGGGGGFGGIGGFSGFGGAGSSSGGGGGAGFGGAIFVTSGKLTLQGVTFDGNTATGGTGANNGKGYGGALFIFNKADNGGTAAPGTTNDPQVFACGSLTYTNNSAADDPNSTANNDNLYGTIVFCSNTSVTSNQNPSITGNNVTFTATVTSGVNPVTQGSVTFTEGATTLASNVALNASGQASFNTSALTEGSHIIKATYNGATGFATSSGSITQVVNNMTTVTGNTFCNTGSITFNDGGTGGFLGTAATPYPSNIVVSGLAGTIQSITVDLKGVVHTKSRDIDLLLVAPTGQKFLMMTGVGAGIYNGFTGPPFIFIPSNLTLSDAAGSALPRSSVISSGTYRPASYESWANTFTAPAPAGPYDQAAPVGSATFASEFNGLNPNGTWRLYATDDTSDVTGSIANGWCLNFVVSQPSVNLSVSPNSGTEAGQTSITVTATASAAVSGNQTVSLGVSGTGITAGDYTLNTTITIPNGSTTGSVTFEVADDALVEGTETATLTISNPSSGITLGSTTTQNITITDNDQALLTFAPSQGSANENIGTYTSNVRLRIISTPVGGTLQDAVTVSLAGVEIGSGAGFATTPADFVLTTSSVTFAAGSADNATQPFDVTIVDDALTEPGEFFDVQMVQMSYNGVPFIIQDGQVVTGVCNGNNNDCRNRQTIRINANDPAGVTITEGGGSTNVTEGGATDTYTVVLTSQPTADVTITLTPNAQVSTNPISLIFTNANWNIAKTVTVTAVDDAIVEGNHTGSVAHTVTSSDVNYNNITISSVTVNITDNDQATLSINSVSKAEGNTGTQFYTFTVTSDKAVDVPFSVDVATANGTATTGDADYVSKNTTLIFSGSTAGETQTFNVTVNGDMTVEPTETFTVPLSTVSASGRNVVISGPSGTGTGTITNDDSDVDAGNDVNICASTNMIQLNGSVIGAATTGIWSTSGSGTFIPNATALDAKYMFSDDDTAADFVELTLTSDGPSAEKDVIKITIDPAATLDAGPDQTVCASSPAVQLAAVLGGAATSGVWNINPPNGNFNPLDTDPNAIYTPSAGEIAAGTVTMIFQTNDPAGVCPQAVDEMIITIDPAATVNAGVDVFICQSDNSFPQLNGGIGGAATSATWSGGNGTFTPNANTLNAVYNPTPAELASHGTIVLTLTTNDPTGKCGLASDQVNYNIGQAATLDAGPDQTVCASSPAVQLAAVLGGAATSGVWNINPPNGSFNPLDTDPNAIYTPTAGEIAAGTVTMTFQTNDPTGACPQAVDEMIITIDPAATVNAGVDVFICQSDKSFPQLNGGIGGAATSATWSGGNGTFTPNANTLNAVYNPTPAELASHGTIVLTLTTNDPTDKCGPASDQVNYNIGQAATLDAGPDQTVCASSPAVQLAAVLGGAATSGVWNINPPNGSFNPLDTDPNAIYTPTPGEITAGTVTMTFQTNDPAGACPQAVDEMIITIEPTVTAGTFTSDVASICKGGSVDFSIAGNTGTITFVVFQDGKALGSYATLDQVEAFFAAADPGLYCVNAVVYAGLNTDCGDFNGFTLAEIIDACLDEHCYDVSEPLCITVLADPVSSLSLADPSICVGGTTKLTYSVGGSDGAKCTYSLIFGGPSGAGVIKFNEPVPVNSTELDVATLLQSVGMPAGEYTFTLSLSCAKGGCNLESKSVTLTVNPNPVGSIELQGPKESCESDGSVIKVVLKATGGKAPYNFSYGDAIIRVNNNCEPVGVGGTFIVSNDADGEYVLTYTGASPGTYTISLDPVSDANGCSDTKGGSVTFTVHPKPVSKNSIWSINNCTKVNIVLQPLVRCQLASTFSWYSVASIGSSMGYNNPNVDGETINPVGTSSTINDFLSNGTDVPQTIIYRVVATSTKGCVSDPFYLSVTVRPRVKVECLSCMGQVNVSLDKNCKFLVKPTHVLNGFESCENGKVLEDALEVVVGNNNDSYIPCAGTYNYVVRLKKEYEKCFIFEPCWGKITAEDKTAPAIVCTDWFKGTLDCYDVNYVLNNPKTIGDLDHVNSPRPAANSSQTINNAEGITGFGNCSLDPQLLVDDNINNLGYTYFADNCRDCGCRTTIKWSDKVVFFNCEQMKTNGGIYAKIYREWVATDCNGIRKDTVQVIPFVRPPLNDFVFNLKDTDFSDKYDRIVTYTSCTPDKSLIKYEDVTPSHSSYFRNSDNNRLLYIDQVECNYSVTIKDTEFPICNGKGVKIEREMQVFDWCAGGIVKTFHILIKIGDFEAPKYALAHHAPFEISTGPMDCTAAFPVTVAGIKSAFGVEIKDNCSLVNASVSVYTKDTYVKGILVATGTRRPYATVSDSLNCNIQWTKVEYAIMNGQMTGVPVGKHVMKIEAFDGCYNASTYCFEFEVKDKIAPVMKCDDKLNISLSNGNGYTTGYAQATAEEINEGSWDNCKLAWIKVRRNVPTGCEASFIGKGYDTNNNGKLDPLPADGDWTKADGFDINGDGKLDGFGETFVLKGGKLMTPLQDIVEFFCCDLTEKVTVELWGADASGNTNFCWMELAIEDKVAPYCAAPWDITVDCDEKCLETIDDKKASVACFGDVTITSGNDCAPMDTVYSTEKKLKCGAGYIDRIWTLTKQTTKGPITITCKQRITIRAIHEYNIVFPKDAIADCKTPIVDTIITDELGCDILSVNVTDKRYDASDDECYKIFRTYTVINWCVYDDRCGDPMAEGNVYAIERSVFNNYGKDPIYVLVRNEDRDEYDEFYISKNSIPNEKDDLHMFGDKFPKNAYKSSFNNVYLPYCVAAEEFYHSFQYTQIIKVYDDTRPVVSGVRDTFCTSATACTGNITKVVTIKDNCTDKVELERQSLMIAPNQTLDASKMITYSTTGWSAKDLGNGQFEIKVSNLPEGTHDLIVVGRDECGNLSLPTRIPFVVKDCKAPAPICINGLSVDLMPDGNNGGMMTVWATDFVASKIYDCNGQDASKGDPSGRPLITKYSVNRVKEAVVPTQTSISVNCADLELGFILVELHAWDEAGNHDFCVTFVEVQDNNKVCPGSATSPVSIAGTISTEGAANLQGANITLSGAASQTATTPTNGAYAFVNLTKGGDFTVTPQLDKNHLNGVSTFDLVLIQKHILGIQALNSPYKLIAADVNNSKSISTLDMIQLRKLILNIDQTFQNNTSWRFVDAAYVFPERSNPWSANFPEVVSVNDFAASVTANFVAIKVGDVNASASVSSATSAEVRTNGHFKLNTIEQSLKSGNEYRVAFSANDLQNIQGYQFALNLDQSKVELLDIEYGVAKAENFGIFKNEGLITTSWNGKYEPGVLFTLVLRAKADAKLSSALSLNRLVSAEAYNQHNENLGVALNYQGVSIADVYELKQNTPNPFSDETVIGFTLPKATKATLSIRDVKGALIYKVEGNYTKGSSQVVLKKSQLGASGVLYYTLETTEFTATKKMVILE